jgi:hypothetical protein
MSFSKERTGVYRVTFEVQCCEDRIEKYLNNKRYFDKDSRVEGDTEEFIGHFVKRHIDAGFCRVKLPLPARMRSLDWVFKWGNKGMKTCEIVKIGESEY